MPRLKELREERNLSLRQLSKMLNFSHSTINFYENGIRSINLDTCRIFADLFEVSFEYFAGYSECYLYVLYELGNYRLKISDSAFKEFKDTGVIYFNALGKRCIDLNTLVGVASDVVLSPFINGKIISNNLKDILKKSSKDEPILLDFNDYLLDIVKDNLK